MRILADVVQLIVELLAFAAGSALLALGGCGSGDDPRVSSAAPVVFQYSIKGMHCQGCVDAITDKVTHIDGVVDCRVSLPDNSAVIAARDASIEPLVRSGIERLGYTVAPLPDATPRDAPAQGEPPPAAPSQPNS